MAIYVDILQNGTNSHGVTVDDFNAFATDFLENGVVGAITNTAGVSPATGAFALNAQGTPDMTLACTAGVAYVLGTPTSGVSQRLRVKMDANQNVTIASNATGGTRYDWVYIKLDADKMKDPAVDASDVATLVTSRSTSASTDNGTPPTFGYNIAVVTVANGAVAIANASVSDKRQQIIPVADASIMNEKLSTTAGEPGGAWKAWTPTFANFTKDTSTISAYYTQIGKTVIARLHVVLAGASVAMGSNPTFTLPVTAIAYPTSANANVLGMLQILDATAGYYQGITVYATTTTALMQCQLADQTNLRTGAITNLVPMTWAATDEFATTIMYEAA